MGVKPVTSTVPLSVEEIKKEANIAEVPMPLIEGPITGESRTGEPQAASIIDVLNHGYIEEEYFITGEARSLTESCNATCEDGKAGYKTRIVVYRPIDQDDYNGTLVVSWTNVTSLYDLVVDLWESFDYLLQEGYAMAFVTAQKDGMDGSDLALVNWDPIRYPDLFHPGDDFSFDIFSQAIQTLSGKPRPDPDPLRGLDAEYVVASGISQSANFLHTYIAEVQADHRLIDGFRPVNSDVIIEEGIPDDVVPVLWQNSEDETDGDGGLPPEDSGQYKLWEVAGASHANYWGGIWIEKVTARDSGQDIEPFRPEVAGQYGELGGASCPNNLFPSRYAYRASLHHVNDWVRSDNEPPSAPRIEREAGKPRTDEYGNAIGGLRLPVVNVPVAYYDARENCNDRFSVSLFGRTTQLSDEVLNSLYSTHADYVDQMQTATRRARDRGWILETDAWDLIDRAEESPIPETSPPL